MSEDWGALAHSRLTYQTQSAIFAEKTETNGQDRKNNPLAHALLGRLRSFRDRLTYRVMLASSPNEDEPLCLADRLAAITMTTPTYTGDPSDIRSRLSRSHVPTPTQVSPDPENPVSNLERASRARNLGKAYM